MGVYNKNSVYKKLLGSKRKEFFKVQALKSVDVVEEDRAWLAPYVGESAKFSGEVRWLRQDQATLMLYDVVIKGRYLDHLWIVLSEKDRNKLKMVTCYMTCRVYFVGTVRSYICNKDKYKYKKYGIYNATLEIL